MTITASTANGAYSTSPITITRTDITPNQTATLEFPHANGGVTLSSRRFAGTLQIAFPAMLSTAGTLQIGVGEERRSQPAAYPIRVRASTMEAAIEGAFAILRRCAGDSLRKQVGRGLNPGELVASGVKLRWAERFATMQWFGVQ